MDQGNEHFQPTTFQVSNLNAGTGAPNVIPGELKARFNLRYSPVQTIERLKQTVEGILRRHEVNFTIEWYVSGEPFYTPQGALSDAVCEAVAAVAGKPPKLSTGGAPRMAGSSPPWARRSSSWVSSTPASTK